MNKRLIVALSFFCVLAIWMVSCEKLENDRNNSSHKEDDSHHKGNNCMNCHYQQGPGEGWFTLAGSLYGASKNHTVRVFDALTQDLLAEVEVDRLGNFYTTDPISYANGTTIDIINKQGQVVKAMSTVIMNGQCNLCHNNDFQDEIIIQ